MGKIAEEFEKEIQEKIAEGIKEAREEMLQLIEDNLLKTPAIVKNQFDDVNGGKPFLTVSFLIPEITFDGEKAGIEIKDSMQEGIAWGNYMGEAVKEYIEKNPDEDLMWIVDEVSDDLWIMQREMKKFLVEKGIAGAKELDVEE